MLFEQTLVTESKLRIEVALDVFGPLNGRGQAFALSKELITLDDESRCPIENVLNVQTAENEKEINRRREKDTY